MDRHITSVGTLPPHPRRRGHRTSRPHPRRSYLYDQRTHLLPHPLWHESSLSLILSHSGPSHKDRFTSSHVVVGTLIMEPTQMGYVITVTLMCTQQCHHIKIHHTTMYPCANLFVSVLILA